MFVFIVLCLAIICAFLGVKKRYSYWQIKKVPQLEPVFPFGNCKEVFFGKEKKFLDVVIQEIYKQFKEKEYQYGGFYSLITPVWMPIDLKLIRRIFQKDFHYFTDHTKILFHAKEEPLSEHLFSLEGEKWKRIRSLLTPIFSSGKMKGMFNLINLLGDKLEEKIGQCQTVNMNEVIECFSTDVIANCGFGLDCKSLDNPDVELRKMGQKFFQPRLLNFLIEFLVPWNVLAFFRYKSIPKEESEYFIKIMTNTLKARAESDTKRNDFVDLMLQLRSEKFTADDILANMFVLYAAGFETTSTTITFCLYEIAKNQDIQDRLRNEIRTVLKKYDNKITYEGLQEMHYAQQCIEETLRLYPVAAAIGRTCTKTYKIPECDLVIEKGTQVLISILGIQRDPEYYDDPLKFDPEHFTKANAANRDSYTWLPFGDGPRQCIGLRFANMQMKIALSCLLRNHRFTLHSTTPTTISFKAGQLTLKSKESIFLNVQKIP